MTRTESEHEEENATTSSIKYSRHPCQNVTLCLPGLPVLEMSAIECVKKTCGIAQVEQNLSAPRSRYCGTWKVR